MLNFSRSEAEEEGLINRLVKRLNDLKKEKETLAIEVTQIGERGEGHGRRGSGGAEETSEVGRDRAADMA